MPLLLVGMFIVSAVTTDADIQQDLTKSWDEDYESLAGMIAQKGLLKSGSTFLSDARIMDEQALIQSSDRDPLDVELRRTEALLNCIRKMTNVADLSNQENRLLEIIRAASKLQLAKIGIDANRKALYMKARALRREIALANPLLNFTDLIFATAGQMGENYGLIHERDHAYSALPGGGIGIVKNITSSQYSGVNLLEGKTIKNGPWAGKDISALNGAFQSFDLSFDARQIVFAWSRRATLRSDYNWKGNPTEPECWNDSIVYHIFIVNIDGSDLKQLTFGNRGDHSPVWLPNGRILFLSERRNAVARCGGKLQPTSTMFSMNADGTDIIQLSWHDVEEWNPSVNNQGMIVYTRWDYIDRDFSEAHHLWLCYPDGRDPRGPHGNYPLPLTTLEGGQGSVFTDGRNLRPWAESYIRAIPGSSKYIAIASSHHSTEEQKGLPVLIDINIRDDNKMAQVIRLTESTCAPDELCSSNTWEGKTNIIDAALVNNCSGSQRYSHPWPLSEDFYIAAEGNGFMDRIFLIDKFGNREILYSGFGISGVSGLPVVCPRPLAPRTKPPVISTATWQGERESKTAPMATISLLDVYRSDFSWPQGTVIKQLRIIQVLPKPWSSPIADLPKLGYASSPNARLIIGTVPVESDGSAYFEAPVEKEIYFQALDSLGCAVQSMRSGTYVHRGEQLSCVGCHEDKWEAIQSMSTPFALKRAPSKIKPEVGGVEPVNFHRLAVPVFKNKCYQCHKEKNVGLDFSYESLEPYAFYFHGDRFCNHVSWLHGGSRTIAGKFGARFSKLYKEGYLGPQHHNVQLTKDELRRIVLWLDANSLELGSYSASDAGIGRQKNGELIWPELDVDPNNPTGVETDKLPPTRVIDVVKKHLKLQFTGTFESEKILLTIKNGTVVVYNPCHQQVEMALYSLSGRLLLSFPSKHMESFSFCDVQRVPLAKGVYIFRAESKDQKAAISIIKSH
jgi:hypothetical protein